MQQVPLHHCNNQQAFDLVKVVAATVDEQDIQGYASFQRLRQERKDAAFILV